MTKFDTVEQIYTLLFGFFKHEVTVYPNSIVLVCAVKTRVYPEICTPYLHVYVFLYLKITCQLAELRH